MKPYERIVVTTDLSECSENAYSHARMLAEFCKSKLSLLYIIEDPSLAKASFSPTRSTLVASGVYKVDEKKLHEQLEQFVAKHFSSMDVEIAIKKTGGSVATAITDYLSSSKASLAIISSHGRTGIKHALIGSIAESVARSASCPVLLVSNKI